MKLIRNFQNVHHSVGNFIPIKDDLFCQSLNLSKISIDFDLRNFYFFHIHTFVNEKNENMKMIRIFYNRHNIERTSLNHYFWYLIFVNL